MNFFRHKTNYSRLKFLVKSDFVCGPSENITNLNGNAVSQYLRACSHLKKIRKRTEILSPSIFGILAPSTAFSNRHFIYVHNIDHVVTKWESRDISLALDGPIGQVMNCL